MRRRSFRMHHRLLGLGMAGALAVSGVAAGGLSALRGAEHDVAAIVRHRTGVERDARALAVAVERVGAASSDGVTAQLRGDDAGAAVITRAASDAWIAQDSARRALAEALGGGRDRPFAVLQAALVRWEAAIYQALETTSGGVDVDEVLAVADAVAPLYAEVRAALTSLEQSLDATAQAQLEAAQADVARARTTLLGAAGALIVLLAGASGLLARRIRRDAAVLAGQDAARLREADRNQFESVLQRGLEMVNDEETSFQLIRAALDERDVGPGAELLLADSSRAHLHQVLHTGEAAGRGCPVGSPLECPAANRGQTMVFPSSEALDACPHLRDRPGGPCSATCVPVSIAGKTIGILHVTGPDGEDRTEVAMRDLEVVGRRASERLTLIRAFAESASQASTDPLTGLFNRRTLEARARELHEEHTDPSYAVVYGDLDHFKLLNDVHGHEGGDRALRLFAGVLRDGVRSVDIAARYGGEEFVVLLPRCAAVEAEAVIARVQQQLGTALAAGRVPSFTASFGIATSRPGASFADVLNTADQALLQAKATGRDRIVLADEDWSGATAPEGEPART